MIHIVTMERGSCRLLLEQKEVKSYSFLLLAQKGWSQLFFKKKKKKNAFLNQGFPGQQEQSQHSLATLSWLVDKYF